MVEGGGSLSQGIFRVKNDMFVLSILATKVESTLSCRLTLEYSYSDNEIPLVAIIRFVVYGKK